METMRHWFLKGADLQTSDLWNDLVRINEEGGIIDHGSPGFCSSWHAESCWGEADAWSTTTYGDGWAEFEDDHIRDRSVEITVR